MTLDTGTCPKWLFERMVRLGREMMEILVAEYGPEEFVRRIADPVWFQSFGTVLAFDWNASGLTTILTAALKEAIRGQEHELGIFICGGKGRTSRKTPEEIYEKGMQWTGLSASGVERLVYNSRMSAKVDSSLVQDGFQLYHHSFFFSRSGAWAVVQQGMNQDAGTARRYHWYSDRPRRDVDKVAGASFSPSSLSSEIKSPSVPLYQRGKHSPPFEKGRLGGIFIKNPRNTANDAIDQSASASLDFVCEPHSGIASQSIRKHMLNMAAATSAGTRSLSTEFIRQPFASLKKDIEILRKHSSALSRMVALKNSRGEQLTLLKLEDREFRYHPVVHEDFSRSKYLEKILTQVTDLRPETYEKFLAIKGVGPKTVRALALVAEVIYGAKPSYEDPARYSFAHGGKDATPYAVDRTTYDNTIAMLSRAVEKSRLSSAEKAKTMRRLFGK